MRPLVIWGVAALAYAAFFGWFTGCSGPLTPEEIDVYVERLRAGAEDPDPARLAALRSFLEADDGGDFIMVNAILMHEHPLPVGDVRPDESSDQVLSRYMAFMWPELLRRACLPVLGGRASITPESWGVEGADRWSTAGLVRYRSRRDLMEIATNPAFADAHQYKIAAMAKTIAFPVHDAVHPGDLRVVVGLLLFSLAALLHLLLGRPQAGRVQS